MPIITTINNDDNNDYIGSDYGVDDIDNDSDDNDAAADYLKSGISYTK